MAGRTTIIVLLSVLLFLIYGSRAEEETIKVGILHSLSGTMAISETPLKDTILLMIKEQNEKGGLLGKKLEPIVTDPKSCWPCFADEARKLIEMGCVVVFGCWTSISRKFVLPVFEELDSMLFYPVQYEGEECSRNVFYTGAAPNQQAIPAVDYLMSSQGGNRTRFVLLGTDYVYPRTTNTILEAYLKSLGIPDSDIKTIYTPFGHSDWSVIVADIKEFSSGAPTAVVSTVNGDANVPFYKELAAQNIQAKDLPVVAFSVGEGELAGLDTTNLVGHLASWNYFMSMNNTLNNAFIKRYQNFVGDPKAVVNDPMEAHYVGFKLWVQAVQQSKCIDSSCVRQAIYQQKVKSLSGFEIGLHPNHHLDKPIIIGEIRSDAQFNILSKVDPVVAEAWSPHLHSPIPTADWTYPWVCGKCLTPSFDPDA